MSVLSEFVHHIISTSYKKLDAATVNRAKDRVLDTLGCIISGRKAPGCSGLIDLLAECGGKKEASVIGTKLKIPVHEAALVNSVLARSFDFEPAGPLVEGKEYTGSYKRNDCSHGTQCCRVCWCQRKRAFDRANIGRRYSVENYSCFKIES